MNSSIGAKMVEPPVRAAPATILAVDDEPANLRLLVEILSQAGYKVRPATTGEQALAAVQTVLPDLILLDIMLPGLDGYQVCQQLKADVRTREIPILFISALDAMLDKVKAFSLGGVDYITKPFQAEDVLARVETHLSLRNLQQQLEQEIAERRRAEQVVRDQNTFLQLVLDSIAYPLYVVNTVDYTVEMANAAARVDPERGAVTCHALTHDDAQPCQGEEHPCPLQAVRETKQPVVVEHVHVDEAGDHQDVEVHVFPIPDREGHVARVLEYAIDVTARKQAEARLRHHEARLAALEERERIGRELHDDLGQVMGYLHVQAQAALTCLAQGQVAPAQVILDQLAQAAQEAQEDVRRHILGIRDSRPPAGGGFVAALSQYLRALHVRYGLETQVSWPDEPLDGVLSPQVESQLLRIIQEALTNVAKHAGADRAWVVLTLHADEVQVIVEDEGRGFDPNQALAAAESPATEHFGLDIMRERAEAVGGRAEVHSSPGRGTRVLVRLPRSLASPSGEGVGPGLRVLLVDDHPLYLEGLRTLLVSRGLLVVGQAYDGLEALDQARALRPDLILMDVQMPRCDGLEATRRIKAELPEVKIVMLTMAAEGDLLFEALKSGASGYLLKSLESTRFFSLLAEVMAGETVLSPDLAIRVLTEFAERDAQPAAPDQALPPEEKTPVLTGRQRQILELVAQGLSNKEIARALYISESTVKYHVSQVLERLQLQSRYELAQYVQGQDRTSQ